eukprot:scaffold1143_cov177-Amphora_coffeaeformis.AAC.10
MSSYPDDVYQWIASMMHSSPADQWSPIVHCQVGDDMDLYQLTEGCYDVSIDFPFLPDDQATILASLQANKDKDLVDEQRRLRLMRFGCALLRIRSTGTNILLDAGVGPYDPITQKCSGHPVPCEPPHPLPTLLAKLGLSLQTDIHFVVYSHLHGDHVGWAAHVGGGATANNEGTIHVMHKREYEYAMYVGCPWRQDVVARFQGKALRLLEEEEEEGNGNNRRDGTIVVDAQRAPGVSLVWAAGHTPGHVCVELKSSRHSGTTKTALYIGDAMHFMFQIQQPDVSPIFDCCSWQQKQSFLPEAYDTNVVWTPDMRRQQQSSSSSKWNGKTSSQARRKLCKRLADKQALLVSPHFSPPGLGYISKTTLPSQQEYDNIANEEDTFTYEQEQKDRYKVIL